MAGLGMLDQAVRSINTVEEYIKVGMEMATEGALDFMENNSNRNNDESKIKIEEYKQVLMEFVQLESDIHLLQNAVKDLPTSGDGSLESLLKERLATLQSTANNRHKSEHSKVVEFNKKIAEFYESDDISEPSGLHTLNRTNSDDVEMTQEQVNIRCPYTGREMVFPMKNKICGHVYDRDGIAAYMQQRKKKAKCPLGGCSNDKPLEVSDLEEHSELRRYIERLNRSKKHKK